MSRRIAFKSEIKDLDLAINALKALDYAYEFKNSSQTRISITGGKLRGASINLSNGEVESDSDYHSHEDLGGLRQAYSEAEFRRVANRQGASIESRVVTNGSIEILCRMQG